MTLSIRTFLFRMILCVAAAFVMLVAGRPEYAVAQANKIAQVLITNSTDAPVPTVAQGTTAISGEVSIGGTPTVSVGNTPTVTAQQSGDWTVGLAGPAAVTNNAAAPLFTRDVSGLAGFRKQQAIAFDPNSCNASTSINVPVGQRLVVEYMTTVARLPTGQRVQFFVSPYASDPGTNGGLSYEPIPSLNTTEPGIDRWIATERVWFFADTEVAFHAFRFPCVGAASTWLTVAGYLIDLP